MKKHYLLAALAATALFTACSNEENNPTLAEGTEVNFMIGQNAITKSITEEGAEGYATRFVDDDLFGIFASGAATSTNAFYRTNDGAGLVAVDAPLTIAATGTASFAAYHPYQKETGANEVVHTVSADQSEINQFNISNFMTATASNITAADPNVSFIFAPRLALLRIEMDGEIGTTTSEIKATALPTVRWTPSTDAMGAAEGEATEITMYRQPASDGLSNIFTAFVPSQTIANGTAFLTITAGDKKYAFKPSSQFLLKAGAINKITVSINAAEEVQIVANSITIKDWEVNDLVITGELTEVTPEEETPGEVVPLIELISEAQGTPTADKTLQPCIALQGTKEGWNALLTTATASTITFDETEAAFKIADDGTGKWHQKMLVFRTPDNAGNLGTYSLSFQVKTTNGKDITVRAMKGQKPNVYTSNGYFKTNTNIQNGSPLGTTAGKWVSKTITLDLGTLNGDPSTTDALTTGIMFCFGTKTDTDVDDIYIKDVKCIENPAVE